MNVHCKPVFPIQVKIATKCNIGSKDFYSVLRDNQDIPARYTNWEKSLNIKISNPLWKQIFRVCFQTIKDNTLIWMQYRILNKILGTNELLYKIGKREDPKCSFCSNEVETIAHLFINCEHTQRFWSDFKK